jgi:hypothetical protein
MKQCLITDTVVMFVQLFDVSTLLIEATGVCIPFGNSKVAVNLIAKIIRRKALELWEAKVRNCEVTPHALWPIAKSLRERAL